VRARVGCVCVLPIRLFNVSHNTDKTTSPDKPAIRFTATHTNGSAVVGVKRSNSFIP